jgi:anti-anti-sigma factor
MFDAIRKIFGVDQPPPASVMPRVKSPMPGARPVRVDHLMTTSVMGNAVVVTFIEPQIHSDHAYAAAEELRAFLLREHSVRDIVFDLENVKYFDSTGLGMLVDLLGALKPRGGRIAIAAATQQVQVLFKLTRLELVFVIRRSVLEALDAIGHRTNAA